MTAPIEPFLRSLMPTRSRRRFAVIRRTGKPHIYRQNREWLVLERTAPGEWWLSPFTRPA